MAQQYDVTMPQDLDLVGAWTIRVTAVDPSTGNTVAGVSVSDMCITADALSAGSFDFGTFMLVPGPGA